MPANTLAVPNVVRVAEDVQDRIYNYAPMDTPLVSMIERMPVNNVFHEWNRDTYRTANAANAAIEGADATIAAQTQPTPLNNRTQIFQDTFGISGTAEAVKKYGRASETKRLKAKKMLEIRKDQELACIASGAAVTGVANTTAGRLRGLYGFLTNDTLGVGGVSPNPVTNTAPTAGTLATLTEANFKIGIQSCYDNGGDASIAMVSSSHKSRISTAFTGNATRFADVTGKSTDVQLNSAFHFYGHDFGVTKVVPNRVMSVAGAGSVNTAYIIDADKLALGVLRPYQTTELGIKGDSQEHQVLTEVTLIVRDEAPMFALRDLTATGV